MNVELLNVVQNERGSLHAHLRCEKVEAYVGFPSYGGINVCCMNAANRVWRGAGKYFPNVDAALANYKSGEMKAMIGAALDEQKRLAELVAA